MTRRARTRARRSAFLLATAAAALACGACGGGARDEGPKLAREDAAPLIFLSNRVARLAASDPCRARREIQRLQARAIRLVGTGRVPVELKEDLMAGVNDLATHPVSCAPPPRPVAAPATTEPDRDAKRKPEEKHKGHRKHGHGEKDD